MPVAALAALTRIGFMAPAPVVDKVKIEFWDTVTLLLLEPKTRPVTNPAPLILLMVLLLRLAVVPEKAKLATCTSPVPPVMLLKVFPVKVFAGPEVLEKPSEFCQPAMIVVPPTVMLE